MELLERVRVNALPVMGSLSTFLLIRECTDNLALFPNSLETAIPRMATAIIYIISTIADIKSTEFGLKHNKAAKETNPIYGEKPTTNNLIKQNLLFNSVFLPIAIIFPAAGLTVATGRFIVSGQNMFIGKLGEKRNRRRKKRQAKI
jgi:hypothetical protein